jgi:hydrogenase expression/formation protein HypE
LAGTGTGKAMSTDDHILLAHGGGGQLMAELIERVILPALGAAGGQQPGRLADSAVVELSGAAGWDRGVVVTTDSYVVQPLEFAGGDIGKLAVCGTINDLAVAGAAPRALSLALVLEEGLEIALLRRVLESAGAAAAQAGIAVVTGDTKVVERGALAGMVINTTGLGQLLPQAELGFERIQSGDRVVLSGPLGEHALAVMSRREGLSLTADLASDCAAIHPLTQALLEGLGPAVRFMRDPTRGGLAATLVEISRPAGRNIEITESAIPVNPTALAAAEMLGLDLLSAANEGKLVAVVAPESADRAVDILAAHPIARRAALIGLVGEAADYPLVEMLTRAGGRRIIQMPYGEELPRIC